MQCKESTRNNIIRGSNPNLLSVTFTFENLKQNSKTYLLFKKISKLLILHFKESFLYNMLVTHWNFVPENSITYKLFNKIVFFYL